MSFVERLAAMPRSFAFAFTPDGRHAARLVDRDGTVTVEVGEVANGSAGAPPAAARVHQLDQELAAEAQLCLPSADLVRLCTGRGGWFEVVEGRREAADSWTITRVMGMDAALVRLLPRLDGAEWDLAVSVADGVSTLWRIEPGQQRPSAVAQIPGHLGGGAWLEPARRLLVDLREPGGTASGFVLDLEAGTYHRLFHVRESSDDRIALFDRGRRRLVVTSDCDGHRRAGVVDLDADRRVRFFPDPLGDDRPVDACGLAADGRPLLRRQHGASTELRLADPGRLTLSEPLTQPAGLAGHPLTCAADRARFPFSGPTVPAVVASHRLGTDRFALDERPDLGDLEPGELVAPRIATFPGPHGPVETLVYDPPPGRRRDLVVVALHGGPAGQWSAAFTPELQLLAGLGALVVAPNYHGSFGYGEAFSRALRGGVGTVDVDDVVATAIRAGGEESVTVLYGHSYGAFLALLVAADHPWLCDGVIAVAPFASLASLRAVGAAPVRRLVDLLGGPSGAEGLDLERRCRDLRARLLIAHGEADAVIPIGQSRALCERLRAHGYTDGRDLRFLPIPGAGHEITGAPAAGALYRAIERFLSELTTTPPPRRGSGRPAGTARSANQEVGRRLPTA